MNSKNIGGGNRGGDLFGALLVAPPTLTPYNDDGTYRNLQTAYTFSSNALQNPAEYLYEVDNLTLADKLLGNAALIVKPIEGLVFKFSGGMDMGNNRYDNYNTTKRVFGDGSASVSTDRYQSLLSENTVSYSKKAGIHDISAVAGITFQNYRTVSLGASGNTFISDTPETYALGAAENFGTPSTGYTDWAMLSYLGRIQYSFNGKYLLTASFRADGSSRYSEDDKWGFFPSGAVAWRVSEEEFVKDIDWISDLKIRAGYGETGSTAISPYYTLNMLTSGKAAIGSGEATWYAPGTRLPAPLKWETTTQSDIGVDLGILNNRFRLTADYYIKRTRDLLNSVQLPASLGYTSTVQNVGEIQNNGLEIGLEAHVFTGDFTWNLSPNISFNRNKVIKLYGGQQINGSSIYSGNLNDYINVLQEGQPMGIFWGYKETGYTETGDIKCEDIEGDGLTAADRRKIGDPNPDFIYGVNSEMTWKGFDFSFFIQGVQGNDLFNMEKLATTMDYAYGHNRRAELIHNTWTPENPNAKYPRARVGAPVYMSDRWVEDGSYLRLKNIQLGYSLPLDKWNANWIRRAQIYVSAQNLLTLSNYSGFDPEINYGGSSVTQGLDYFTYSMTAKSWTFGIKLEF
jgi:TonB-linked SusC/RagA family outer membrane protein